MHALTTEAERALELIGRAIRMAGYQNIQSIHQKIDQKNSNLAVEIHKRSGYQASVI